MSDRNDKLETPEGEVRSADEVRQGEIVLKSKRRLMIFIGAVAAAAVIAVCGAVIVYSW